MANAISSDSNQEVSPLPLCPSIIDNSAKNKSFDIPHKKLGRQGEIQAKNLNPSDERALCFRGTHLPECLI